VTMTDPGLTHSSRNARSVDAWALGMTRRRHRPNPVGLSNSTATATSDLPSAPRPRFPGLMPPMNISLTSTSPASGSRAGRTIAARKRCSMVQAVWYEPKPRSRCRVLADTPFFAEVMYQAAANQTVRGVRVPWKIVPVVTDTRHRHDAHQNRPSPIRQRPGVSHRGHTKPLGQRSHSR
jgi:hypothetical protein